MFGGLLQETVEFESFMLPEENNIAFPGHVTEASLGVSQVAIDVDSALEAVEGKWPFMYFSAFIGKYYYLKNKSGTHCLLCLCKFYLFLVP